MSATRRRWPTVAAAVPALVVGSLALPADAADDRPINDRSRWRATTPGLPGLKTFASQEAAARLAPYAAVVAREYGEALGSLRGLPSNGSRWSEVTDRPYDSNDPEYRDPSVSNSGAGWGDVAGRITSLAVGNGWVFAAGANGGVSVSGSRAVAGR